MNETVLDHTYANLNNENERKNIILYRNVNDEKFLNEHFPREKEQKIRSSITLCG